MASGRVLSAAVTAIIGLLVGALIGVLSGDTDAVVDRTASTQSDTVDADDPEDEAPAESDIDPERDAEIDLGGSEADDPPAPETEEPEPEPIALDLAAVDDAMAGIALVEAVGCGGASRFTAFNDGESGVYPAELATHNWFVTTLSGADGRVSSQIGFPVLTSGAGGGGLVRSAAIPGVRFFPASFDVEIGLEVAVLGADDVSGFGIRVLGTVTGTTASGPVVSLAGSVPTSFVGGPVVAGQAELVGVYTSEGVIGLEALATPSALPDTDCRTATHSLPASQFASARVPETQEILAAQNWVNVTASGDFPAAEALDVGRTSAVNWAQDYGPLERGWIVPIERRGGGAWRLGYHTFEARDSRDTGRFDGFSLVNRIFCVTWVMNGPAGTVNQQTARNTHRPNASDRNGPNYPSYWNRVDTADASGLIDTNALVGDLIDVC